MADYQVLRSGKSYRRTESKPFKGGSSNAAMVDLPERKSKMSLGSGFTLITGFDLNSHYYNFRDIPVNVGACRTDEDDLDQLVIRYGPVVQILRNNPTREKAQSEFMTFLHHISNDVQWSPLGSYLVSVERNVAILWGSYYIFGPMLMRYWHPNVTLVDFSPGEKYLVTYNRPEPSSPSELQIFDVRTGKLLMGGYGGVTDVSWPVIRWAGGKDDKYFAMLTKKKTISVYETHNFSLLPIKFNDVVDMDWSPTEPILALLLKGCGKQPAKVALVQIPGMVKPRYTDLPDVYEDLDCKMYWQSNGEYIAVKVDRHTYSVFVLIRVKETHIPMEVLKVDEKVLAFAWEPSGHRFAMIHGDQSVSFYTMQNLEKVSKLATFKEKQADALFWSPRGKHIVLAGLKGSFNGQFEFFDVDKLETMNKGEHLMATDIAWDPTGRYVATAYTISQEMEKGFKKGFQWDRRVSRDPANGFFIWSFKGDKLYWKKAAKEYRLLQLSWRPYGGSIDDEMLKNLELKNLEKLRVSENSDSCEIENSESEEEESENSESEEESENSESEEESEKSDSG